MEMLGLGSRLEMKGEKKVRWPAMYFWIDLASTPAHYLDWVEQVW